MKKTTQMTDGRDLWAGDGHVTDVVVDLMAEGREDLLPVQVTEHVMGCEVCAGRMGASLAMLEDSYAAVSGLEASVLVELRDGAGRAASFPVVGVLVAAAVAVLGTLPWVQGFVVDAAQVLALLVKWAPKLLVVVVQVIDGGSRWGIWPSVMFLGAAVVLGLTATWLVRVGGPVRARMTGGSWS